MKEIQFLSNNFCHQNQLETKALCLECSLAHFNSSLKVFLDLQNTFIYQHLLDVTYLLLVIR